MKNSIFCSKNKLFSFELKMRPKTQLQASWIEMIILCGEMVEREKGEKTKQSKAINNFIMIL